MSNLINVGVLFQANNDVTRDVIAAVKRDGAEQTSTSLMTVTPGVLKAILKRHYKRGVVRAS